MKCLILILNKTEKLDELLAKFSDNGINGATILSSTGMARQLMNNKENDTVKMFGSLRFLLNPDRAENKTIFCVLSDDQVLLARGAINAVLGNLNQPDTGIVFTVPVDFIDGGCFTA